MEATVDVRTREKDWVNILFLMFTPVIAVVGTVWYTLARGFEPWMAVLFVVSYLLVGLSICAGYHRYFSHKSYEASPAVQVFYAIFGALAAQNSILWWSSSHRVHHQYVDKDWDPYNIKRGFWWAHIFWIFYRNPEKPTFANSPDLMKNPIVMWQNRWHKVLMVVVGFGVPTLIGAMYGRPLAGLLWGGFLRVAVIHHTTFFVNSLAHFWGEPKYSAEQSARDNWAVAFLTLGEGYHSFHHRFPADYRNGIRWYQWDPTKWFIRALKGVGLASDLRSMPAPVIEQARLAVAMAKVETHMESKVSSQRLDEVRARIASAREALDHAIELWRKQADERFKSAEWREIRDRWRARLREAKREMRIARRMLAQVPNAA